MNEEKGKDNESIVNKLPQHQAYKKINASGIKKPRKIIFFGKFILLLSNDKSDCEFHSGLMTAFSYKRSLISITFYGFYRLLKHVNEENFCLFGGCPYDNRLCGQCTGSQ